MSAGPVFDRPRVVGRPNAFDKRRVLERMEAVLDSGWYTNRGPQVRALEERFAALCGVRHAIAVANATLGLELVVRATTAPGARVLVPAFTFPGTALAVVAAGRRLVYADVDEAFHLLDPATATGDYDAALPVHLWGGVFDADLGVPLVFDAAHAVGCAVGDRPVGGGGRASVFSLHATKFVSAFEGGLITTNDDALADELRSRLVFGFQGDRVAHLDGTNAKMTEIHAVMAHVSFDGLPELMAHHAAVRARYGEGLAGVVPLWGPPPGQTVNHQYVVAMHPERDRLIAHLGLHGVVCAPYFTPPSYRHPALSADVQLPTAERLAATCLCLPTGTQMSLDDVDVVCDLVRRFGSV
jgi:dTDP-4-amino-4,6-dideoxyglucose